MFQWKPGYLYFCIYFAYFSICLSEYVISLIYLLCTCVVHRVFVDAKFFNHEGVLVLHVSWTNVCITKQTSWCLRVSLRPFENGFNNTKLDYPSAKSSMIKIWTKRIRMLKKLRSRRRCRQSERMEQTKSQARSESKQTQPLKFPS